MIYVRTRYHQTAVLREESAAARAKCVESSYAHNILADLHRSEVSALFQIDMTREIARWTVMAGPRARIVAVLAEDPLRP